MRLEVLVSTMNQNDTSLVQRMNLQSDAIIINQCDENGFESISYSNFNVRFFSLVERGVGLSRNTALMLARGDICLMADDDLEYVDGYEEIVLNAFKSNPKADVIMFNVPIYTEGVQKNYHINKEMRIRFYNFMKFGTVHMAFRRSSVLRENIYFSLLFGGGAKYSSGEDSLFIKDALSRGLKIYTSREIIAKINEKESSSTWFSGYNTKYFYDRGALFGCLSKRWAKLLCIQFVLRHYKRFKGDVTRGSALKTLLKGTKEF